MTSGGRKIKERALKEISNVLDARPVNLKPVWTGLKSGSGSGFKEVGPKSKWATQVGGPSALLEELVGRRDVNSSEGPTHCRPPDPPRVPDPETSNPQKVPQSFQADGCDEGGGKQDERETDDEVFMDAAMHVEEPKEGHTGRRGQHI